MKHYEWTEGKTLVDNLTEMGFVEPGMSFRKRALLADYLDTYLDRRDKEHDERQSNMKAFMGRD